MESGRPTTTRRPRVRRIPLGRAFSRVLAISAVATVLLVAGLSIQMSLGKDPALGPKLASARAKSAGTSAGGSGSGSSGQSPLQALVGAAEDGSAEGELSADDAVVIVPSTPSAAPTTVAPAPAPVVTSTS